LQRIVLWLLFPLGLLLTGCTVERHFPKPGVAESKARFQSDIEYCVGSYDPDHLISVKAGDEYDVSGWFTEHSARGNVMKCMQERGWPATPVPWFP
jgi:hypothetical protein